MEEKKVKFITVRTALGDKTIAVDNIASVEAFGMGGSRIVLKEIKDGNSVEVICTSSVTTINNILHLS